MHWSSCPADWSDGDTATHEADSALPVREITEMIDIHGVCVANHGLAKWERITKANRVSNFLHVLVIPSLSTLSAWELLASVAAWW